MSVFLSTEDAAILWLAVEEAPTRGKARLYAVAETGACFFDAMKWRVLKRYMRPAYGDEREGNGYFEIEGMECPASHPQAAPYWRIETQPTRAERASNPDPVVLSDRGEQR